MRTLVSVALVVFAAVLVAGLPAVANNRDNTPSYYDGLIFMLDFKELPSNAERETIDHNPSINIVYESEECSPGGSPFVFVIDAIPGDGMNALWREVQIHFTNPTFPCQQFVKDDDITAAAAAGNITLEFTSQVYRCSVVGKKPIH